MTYYDPELDEAQVDADGHPECGDEYCPGFPDCPTCRRLREAEWQRYETTGVSDVGDPTPTDAG